MKCCKSFATWSTHIYTLQWEGCWEVEELCNIKAFVTWRFVTSSFNCMCLVDWELSHRCHELYQGYLFKEVPKETPLTEKYRNKDIISLFLLAFFSCSSWHTCNNVFYWGYTRHQKNVHAGLINAWYLKVNIDLFVHICRWQEQPATCCKCCTKIQTWLQKKELQRAASERKQELHRKQK